MSYLKFMDGRARRAGVTLVMACLAGCGGRESTGPHAAATPRAAAPVAATPIPEMKDVLETTAGHVVGISYPARLAKYPGLAVQAKRFADDARSRVMQAEAQRKPAPGEGPFELSLEFQLRHESPRLVVLAVDGSSFTGGAQGTPLIERWVWLPDTARRLTPGDLFPTADGWKHLAGEVRAQLTADLTRRLDADDAPPADRRALMKSAGAMIEAGTSSAANLSVFEPVPDADGRIAALRFVFPPYQVGPYAEGVHTAEIPASRVIADIAPAYRQLFATTP